MTTEDPRRTLERAVSEVMKAITHTGECRIRWERAKATADPQIFALAQAHRTSEKDMAEATEKAVQAYIVASKSGVITLGAPASAE